MRIQKLLAACIVVAALIAAGPLEAARDLRPHDSDLFGAVREGSVDHIAAALQKGANPNAVDEQGMTALMRALVDCDANAVRLLLDKGADANKRSAGDSTPLVLAAGDFAKVKALVERGADVNARSGADRTALHAAAAQRDSYRLVTYLVEKGADANARDNTPEFLSGGIGGPL
jgi:ankyrin repeat protein